jgi:DNA-binding transcriptional MocR family regulator
VAARTGRSTAGWPCEPGAVTEVLRLIGSTGGETHGAPMALCEDAPDWHRTLAAHVCAARSRLSPAEPAEALRGFVRREFGAEFVHSHDWYLSRGSGAVLDHLFAALPTGCVGSLLPTYQRVARAVAAGRDCCVRIAPDGWTTAVFQPPVRSPAALVVNGLHANPTATTLLDTYLADLAEYARHNDVLLIEDDAFRGTGDHDGDRAPLLRVAPERTVYLASWTKLLGWPVKFGLVGWPRAAGRSAGLQPPAWSPPFAGHLADLLMGDVVAEIRALRRRRFDRRRRELAQLLDRCGIRYLPPSGGMHLTVLDAPGTPLSDLARRLTEERIGCLPGTDFLPPGEGDGAFLRLGLSNVDAARWPALLAALSNVLDQTAGRRFAVAGCHTAGQESKRAL